MKTSTEPRPFVFPVIVKVKYLDGRETESIFNEPIEDVWNHIPEVGTMMGDDVVVETHWEPEPTKPMNPNLKKIFDAILFLALFALCFIIAFLVVIGTAAFIGFTP